MTENISKLRSKLKRAEELKAQAQGSLDTLLQRLQEDYGIDSVEQAEEELARARKDLKKTNKQLAELETKFNEEWKDVLD